MKRSPEMMSDYIRVLSAQCSYAKTSRLVGIDASTFWIWVRESRAAKAAGNLKSPYYFEHERETKFFHQFVRGCVTRSRDEIEAAAFGRAQNGTYVEARFQGRTVYKQDPSLVGRPDLVAMLGLPDDLLRDEQGRCIPQQVWVPPSTDLVAMVLAARAPKLYGKKSTIDVNQKLTGGVVIMGRRAPPQIAAPLPMVEIIKEAEPEPVLRDEPAPAEVFEDFTPPEPAPVPTIEPVIREVPLTQLQPGPNPLIRKLTDTERALLSRLPDSNSRGRS